MVLIEERLAKDNVNLDFITELQESERLAKDNINLDFLSHHRTSGIRRPVLSSSSIVPSQVPTHLPLGCVPHSLPTPLGSEQ